MRAGPAGNQKRKKNHKSETVTMYTTHNTMCINSGSRNIIKSRRTQRAYRRKSHYNNNVPVCMRARARAFVCGVL